MKKHLIIFSAIVLAVSVFLIASPTYSNSQTVNKGDNTQITEQKSKDPIEKDEETPKETKNDEINEVPGDSTSVDTNDEKNPSSTNKKQEPANPSPDTNSTDKKQKPVNQAELKKQQFEETAARINKLVQPSIVYGTMKWNIGKFKKGKR